MRSDWFRSFAAETGRWVGAFSATAGASPTPVAPVARLSPKVAAMGKRSQVPDNNHVPPIVAPVAPVAPHPDGRPAWADAVPKEWKDGLAILCTMEPSPSFAPMRWGLIVADAVAFLDQWGLSAVALGWTTLDLFGVGRDAPYHRLDLMGLVPLLGGKMVVALTTETARIKCGDGTLQTYCRKLYQPGRVPLWEL